MRRLLLCFAVFTAFFSCTKETKTPDTTPVNEFAVVGTMPQNYNGKKVQLLTLTNDVIGTETIENSAFTISSPIKVTNIYKLVVQGNQDTAQVVLSEQAINLSIENDSIFNFGSNQYQQQYLDFTSKLSKIDTTARKDVTFINSFIQQNANSDLATAVVNMLKDNPRYNYKDFNSFYSNLDSIQQNTLVGSALKNHLAKQKSAFLRAQFVADSIAKIKPKKAKKPKKKVIKRQSAPLFAGDGMQGENVDIRPMVKHAKVTIIDFWASWCGPCRISNPHLKRLYRRYKDRGLQIIGVSEDKDKNAWLNAIAQDQLPWPHILDDNQRIAFMYGVTAIPHYVVLDQNGGFYKRKTSGGTLEADIITLLNE